MLRCACRRSPDWSPWRNSDPAYWTPTLLIPVHGRLSIAGEQMHERQFPEQVFSGHATVDHSLFDPVGRASANSGTASGAWAPHAWTEFSPDGFLEGTGTLQTWAPLSALGKLDNGHCTESSRYGEAVGRATDDCTR